MYVVKINKCSTDVEPYVSAVSGAMSYSSYDGAQKAAGFLTDIVKGAIGQLRKGATVKVSNLFGNTVVTADTDTVAEFSVKAQGVNLS